MTGAPPDFVFVSCVVFFSDRTDTHAAEFASQAPKIPLAHPNTAIKTQQHHIATQDPEHLRVAQRAVEVERDARGPEALGEAAHDLAVAPQDAALLTGSVFLDEGQTSTPLLESKVKLHNIHTKPPFANKATVNLHNANTHEQQMLANTGHISFRGSELLAGVHVAGEAAPGVLAEPPGAAQLAEGAAAL